uniref:Uncharacterized protein n=1 Tax=Oryza barthii TaxID=65489 RepID=A0A0D3GBM4_9ORYZ
PFLFPLTLSLPPSLSSNGVVVRHEGVVNARGKVLVESNSYHPLSHRIADRIVRAASINKHAAHADPHLAKGRPPATISSKPQATGTPLSLSSVNSIDLLRLRPSLTGIPVDAKIRCRLRWIRRTKVKTVHPFVAAKERRTPPSPWTRPRRCLKLPLPSVVVELPLGCDSGVGTERRAPIPVGSDGRWASSSATTQVHAAAAEAARGGGW